VFCPECWLNEKSILLRHILTSAAARLEFVTTRNYVENLRLSDVMLTRKCVYNCFVAKDKHFFILIWLPTTVVRLCSIHRHKIVWCNLVLALKASLREYERGWLCCVMTSGENIFTSKRKTTKFYKIQNLILKMDIRAFLDSVVNDNQKKARMSIMKICKTIRNKRRMSECDENI
jgi:hypothetical protein